MDEERKKKLLEAVDVVCGECVYAYYCDEENRCYNCPVRLTVNEVNSASNDIHQFLVQYTNKNNHLWGESSSVMEQIRSIFVTYCLMKDIKKDTELCENLISELFIECKICEKASKNDFKYFMLYGLN